MPPLKIVLDTNALLRSLSRGSPFAFVLDKLYEGEYELWVSKDILLEYEEKISDIISRETAELVLGALALLPNVKKADVHYHLLLISADHDITLPLSNAVAFTSASCLLQFSLSCINCIISPVPAAADILNRIAKALDVTTDYLLNGTLQDKSADAISDEELLSQFRKIEKLPDDKKKLVKEFLDAFIFKADLQKQLSS